MKKTKGQLQTEALDLSKLHKSMILEWATGVGKSLAAINMIEDKGGFWNIVIAETNHEMNWIDEFKAHNKEYLLENVNFFCYHSLHKHTNGVNYIFDEIHHVTSDKRLQSLNEIYLSNLENFIGLSATLTKTQKILIESAISKYYVHKVSLDQAIEWEILPQPIIYLVEVELDNIKLDHTFIFNKQKSATCTQQGWYNFQTTKIELLKERYYNSRKHWDKISWLKSANDRKKFLSKCKTKYAKIVLDRLESKRLICFTGSIDQSLELNSELAVHSKISKEKRQIIIDNFNSGKTSKLFATGMLKEGQNLNDIEAGIIIQLDNVDRYFIQVTGRTLRAKFPEQYIMYVKNTQDRVYLQKVLDNIDGKFIKDFAL